MTGKVNYDPQTGLAKGYYPDSINYSSIPEPYIEISEKQHQDALGKTMCVVDGIYQEYVAPYEQRLLQAKQMRIQQLKVLRDSNILRPIFYSRSLPDGSTSNLTFNLGPSSLAVFSGVIDYLKEQGRDATRKWKDIEGNIVSLGIDDFQNLRNHFLERDEREYSKAKVKIDAVRGLRTIEEVEQYPIES